MAPVEKVLVEKNAINEVAKGIEKMKVEKKSTNLYEDKEHFDPNLEPLLREDPGRFVIFPINYPGEYRKRIISQLSVLFHSFRFNRLKCYLMKINEIRN